MPGVVRSYCLRGRPPATYAQAANSAELLTLGQWISRGRIPPRCFHQSPRFPRYPSAVALPLPASPDCPTQLALVWSSLVGENDTNLRKSDRPLPANSLPSDLSTPAFLMLLEYPNVNTEQLEKRVRILFCPQMSWLYAHDYHSCAYMASFKPLPNTMFTSRHRHKISWLRGINPSIFRGVYGCDSVNLSEGFQIQ